MKTKLLFLFLHLLLFSNAFAGVTNSIQFKFYSEVITFNYDQKFLDVTLANQPSVTSIDNFLVACNNVNYMPLIQQFLTYKKKLELNDWLYYKLIDETTQAIFATHSKNFQTAFCWFILIKSNYDAQLNFTDDKIVLSVFSYDEVFEIPRRIDKSRPGGYYVHINLYTKALQIKAVGNSNNSIAITPILNARNTKSSLMPFSFSMAKLPAFTKPVIVNETRDFIHNGKRYAINFKLNQSIVEAMHESPELSVYSYSKIPLSPEAYSSITEELQELIKDKSEYEAARILLSFTRQISEYAEDSIYENAPKNLTFSAEETLFYPYSDCEDRAVLFAYLVKQLLKTDVILMDYPKHVNTAVLFSKPYGTTNITYKNKTYTVCDPTGPDNTLKPGENPTFLKNIPLKVLQK